jgi:hypothetical protein
VPIDNSKETYLQYRIRARELYERGAVFHGESFGTNEVVESISVPEHANVQVCDEGAFVEAIVWVPKNKLQRPTAVPYTTLPQPCDAGECLVSSFGRREAELAAIEIVKRARAVGHWRIAVCRADMPEDQMELRGFDMLVGGAHLLPVSADYFTPSASFIQIVTSERTKKHDNGAE